MFKKKKSNSITLKDLNVENLFAENFRMRKNFTMNVKSYRVNDALNVYLKKRTYLLEMTNNLKKKFKKTYNIDSQ